ncbi:ABC transporter substrate-binding protein [uncultured Treponema sp.]|uniref:substrate-binding periplasmic protein n=1 Tax=uncultured Treponema sp. TaxID=162155 RepID=UPI0015C05192|nr:transporter substrate-binding domain-containing protein [uncultured Treponema sp.]
MKRFARVFFVAVALIVSASLFGCRGKESSKTEAASAGTGSGVSKKLAELRKKGKLVFGSSGDEYSYINQATGKPEGIDSDIVIEACRRLGIPNVEMALIPFSELILNCNNGTIDLIADGMYNSNPDRAKKVYFCDSIYWQGGALVIGKDAPYKSQYDMAGAKVGYTPGTIWQGGVEAWAKKGIIGEAVATGHQTDSLVALQFGKIDAFLTDSTVVEGIMIHSPAQMEGLKLAEGYVDDEIPRGHISCAVNLEDADFAKELNKVFKEMREDGTIEKIIVKYGFDPKLHCYAPDADYETEIKCPVNIID